VRSENVNVRSHELQETHNRPVGSSAHDIMVVEMILCGTDPNFSITENAQSRQQATRNGQL
jgi:hypothetical protein